MSIVHPVAIGPLTLGPPAPLLFIGGPCVIESASHALDLGREVLGTGHRARSLDRAGELLLDGGGDAVRGHRGTTARRTEQQRRRGTRRGHHPPGPSSQEPRP